MLKVSLLNGTDNELKRQEIRAYLLSCYNSYELVCDVIEDERAYVQKSDLLHHLITSYWRSYAISSN